MAGLLAAERPLAAAHLVDHVAVADLGDGDLDPLLLHRLVEAEVAHHGDDDAAVELAAGSQATGGQGDQLVAVVDLAVPVDREDAVAVAVEGEADARLGGGDALGQALHVGGAAAGVDVLPVGLDPDRLDLGAEALEDRRRGAVGGAVGAVEHYLATGEVEREGLLQLAQVVLQAAVQLPHVAGVLGRRRLVDQRLDPGLDLVGELHALAVEELDPVVVEGVVGGGDDRGEVEAEALDEDRGGGGRQDAGQQRVPACGGDSGGQRGLQHRPRLAGVADDQDLGPLGLQGGRGRPAQGGRQLGAEEGASLSPDPVGSEELARGRHPAPVSAC